MGMDEKDALIEQLRATIKYLRQQLEQYRLLDKRRYQYDNDHVPYDDDERR